MSRSLRAQAAPDAHNPSSVTSRPGANPYLMLTRDGARVDLIALASAAGLRNLPASDDQQLSEFEDLVVSEHVRQQVERAEATRGLLSEYEASFGALEDQLPTPRDLWMVVEAAAASVERELGDERALVPERQSQQQARRDLNHFVNERSLTHPARYPRSRRLHLGWVAVLATLEALANSAFFASISLNGLIGGLLTAAAIAALNTGSGVLVGYMCLRSLHHPRTPVRWLAAAWAMVYAASDLAFNFAVGRARDLAEAGTLYVQALPDLLRHPFDLSLLSMALVGVGLIASALALYKGRTLDDVVPGYGDLNRRFVRADERFSQSATDFREAVLRHVENVPEGLHAVVRQGEQTIAQLGHTVVGAGKALEAYEADVKHLATRCAGLLRRVREANVRVRTTGAPKHFSCFPEFSSEVDPAPLHRLQARLVQAKARLDELKAGAHALRGQQAERVKSTSHRLKVFLETQMHRAESGPDVGYDVDDTNSRMAVTNSNGAGRQSVGWRAQL